MQELVDQIKTLKKKMQGIMDGLGYSTEDRPLRIRLEGKIEAYNNVLKLFPSMSVVVG